MLLVQKEIVPFKTKAYYWRTTILFFILFPRMVISSDNLLIPPLSNGQYQLITSVITPVANLAPILKAFLQSLGNSSFRLFAFFSGLNDVTTYLA